MYQDIDSLQPQSKLTIQQPTALNINQRKSKSWDMRLHWLREKEGEKEVQKQLAVYWDSGGNNTVIISRNTTQHLTTDKRFTSISMTGHSHQLRPLTSTNTS